MSPSKHSRLKTVNYLLTLLLLGAINTGATHGQIDLRDWNQEGPSGAGNWNVAGDGTDVFQTTNGAPTFFVSPNEFINTTVTGRFGVETTSDDDFIGFVFGYRSPISANGDPDLSAEFILFDWKQNAQSGAPEGFWLGKVSGTQNGVAGIGNQLWPKIGDSNLEVLSFGTPLVNDGWQDNVVYEFELVYTQTEIQIFIQGGNSTFATQQLIFEVDIADLPMGTFANDEFPSGRFGFYNHSQSSVRYESFEALTEVLPDSIVTTRGTYVSGDLASISASDNSDYVIQRSISDIISRTEFEVTSTCPIPNPSLISVVLEGAVFARSTVTQTIELYDHDAKAWEEIDSRNASDFADSVVRVDILSDFERFIEPTSLEMLARVRYRSLNPRQRFSSNTDKFHWLIGD